MIINILLRAFSVFWSIRTIKYILFYLYLWQLKEYQFSRFIDHFRTFQGKRLFLNLLFFVKSILFILFCIGFFFLSSYKINFFWLIFFVLFLIYLFEALFFLFNILKDRYKKPVFTFKVFFLFSFAVLTQILYFFLIGRLTKSFFVFIFLLLLFDIFLPIIVSLIVLFFQPFVVLIRNEIIKKAIKRRNEMKNLTAVGITGSYAKTSVKEFLSVILSSKFKVLKTKKNENSEIGIARCILNHLTPDYEIFIAEMGAYKKGGIEFLSKIVKPKIGIITGVNEQHLALFKTMDNLISAEGGIELVQNLPKEGTVILNKDNKIISEVFLSSKDKKQEERKKILVSANKKADLYAENIKVEPEFISFDIILKNGERTSIKANLAGVFNVINLLLASAAAIELGMSLREIKEGIKKIKINDGTIKIFKNQKGVVFLDSTYSSNPDGVLAGLEYLKLWPGKKIVIMPCLIELGKRSKEIHKQIGRKIGKICDLAIITSKDRFDEIKKGVLEVGADEDKIIFLKRNQEIINKINSFCVKNDVVLLEGRISKEIVNALKNNLIYE